MLIVYNNSFHFVNYKNTFTQLGVTNIVYTQNQDDIKALTNKNPLLYGNVKTEPFIPTPEQSTRLTEVNELKLQYKNNFMEDVLRYVEYGVLTNRAGELSSIAKKATDTTKDFLIDILKKELFSIKTKQADDGIELYGRRFDSDTHARMSVTGYLVKVLKDKALGKVTDLNELKFTWKDYNNQFIELTFDQLNVLSDELLYHIQAAFAAEDLSVTKLKELSVENLLSFPSTKQYYLTGKTYTGPSDDELADITAIYYTCYKGILKILKGE